MKRIIQRCDRARDRLIRQALSRKPSKQLSPPSTMHPRAPAPRKAARVTPSLGGADILLTGGVGDFIAVESFLGDVERSGIRRVFLATRAAQGIESLLSAGRVFPGLESVVTLNADWSDLFCVISLGHLRSESARRNWDIDFNMIPGGIVDYSILHIFPEIAAGRRHYSGSSLLAADLAVLSRFDLPTDFALIQPCSPNDRQGGLRDFTPQEWDATIRHLRKVGRPGIVVQSSDDPVPDHPSLVSLATMTSLPEAVEIAKRCSEYIGVDSCLAAVVTKVLPPEAITIKTVNDHYKANLGIYCAPQRQFEFVTRNITQKW